MKRIIIVILVFLIVVSICSCEQHCNDNIIDNITYIDADATVDELVMGSANGMMDIWGLEEGRTFSVTKDEKNIYHIDLNGEEMLVQIEEEQIVENVKSNITGCDSKVLGIVKALKGKIINYINESDILKDKKNLVKYIYNLPVQMADFCTDAEAEYDERSDTIYINNRYRSKICEWGITH